MSVPPNAVAPTKALAADCQWHRAAPGTGTCRLAGVAAILRRVTATANMPAVSVPRRARFDATVEFNRPVCREHFLLRMRIDRGQVFPPTKPGVFIQLGCRTPDGAADFDALGGHDLEWQPGEMPPLMQPELCHSLALFRRPFSLAGRGDDAHGTWIEVIHRVVGVGTAWLAALKPGDAVDLIGPLGNHFELPANKSIGLLVGGGVGLPPMFYLAEAMRAKNWQAVGFVGAMTARPLGGDVCRRRRAGCGRHAAAQRPRIRPSRLSGGDHHR